MKKLFLTIALCAFATVAFGQFATRAPAVGAGLGNVGSGYRVDVTATLGTTNVNGPACALLSGGLAFFAKVGATNQTMSNMYFRIQVSPDAVNWFNNVGQMVTNDTSVGLIQVQLPMDKIGENVVLTNLIASTATLGWKFARIHSISNSAYLGANISNNVWITNCWLISMEQ